MLAYYRDVDILRIAEPQHVEALKSIRVSWDEHIQHSPCLCTVTGPFNDVLFPSTLRVDVIFIGFPSQLYFQ